MPQLMPLYWNISILMVLFIFMSMLMMFFKFEKHDMLFNSGSFDSNTYWKW